MFSTFVSAVRSRGAVALVGATTTGLALHSRSKWKGEAETQYRSRLIEETKVTELTVETQMLRQAIYEIATIESVEEPLEGAVDRAVAFASLSAMMSFMGYAASVVAISNRGVPLSSVHTFPPIPP